MAKKRTSVVDTNRLLGSRFRVHSFLNKCFCNRRDILYRSIEPKSRILSVALGEATRFVPGSHVVAWAVPERQAFVSSLFMMRGQQPLRLSSEFNDVFVRQQKAQKVEIDLAKVRNKFDYFWLFNSGDGKVAIPASWLLVHKRGAISVWRIR